MARIAKFLQPEIDEKLVTVDDQADRSIIVLLGDGMFDSGSIDVKPRYVTVIDRVANALNSVPGAVRIVGHTDNQPIRSLRFPSNYELSQARAEVVRGMIEAKLVARGRTAAQGKGEAEPIDDNKKPEGRSRNRRVEVTLLVPPAERDRELAAASGTAPTAPTAPAASAGQGKQ